MDRKRQQCLRAGKETPFFPSIIPELRSRLAVTLFPLASTRHYKQNCACSAEGQRGVSRSGGALNSSGAAAHGISVRVLLPCPTAAMLRGISRYAAIDCRHNLRSRTAPAGSMGQPGNSTLRVARTPAASNRPVAAVAGNSKSMAEIRHVPVALVTFPPPRSLCCLSGRLGSSSVVGRRSVVGAVVIVTPRRVVFAPPMPTPRLLAPFVPAPCTLTPAIVVPPVSALAIPSVVGTRRSGAQSRNEYGGGSEKKSRSAHSLTPRWSCIAYKTKRGRRIFRRRKDFLESGVPPGGGAMAGVAEGVMRGSVARSRQTA